MRFTMCACVCVFVCLEDVDLDSSQNLFASCLSLAFLRQSYESADFFFSLRELGRVF